MIRAAAKLLLILALILPASAAPRFAVVRVTDIYRMLSSTAALQKELQQERDDLLKDERAEQLRKLVAQLQEMQAQFQQKKDQQTSEETRKMSREFEIKRQEAQTLQQEFETFRQERNREINRRMVHSMRESLGKIVTTSQRLATEQGFIGVFDSSGNSNTGVPALLYVKDAKDLTDNVVASLKDAGDPPFSAEVPATPAPAPAAVPEAPAPIIPPAN